MKPLKIEDLNLISPAGDRAGLAAAWPAAGLAAAITRERLTAALAATVETAGSLRRTPRLARLALAAAAGLAGPSQAAPGGEGLILISAHGSAGATFEFMDSLLGGGAALASPTAFAHSVTNMTAAFLNQRLNLTGPTLTLVNDALSPALEAASALLASGQAETLILGAAAELSPIMDEAESRAGRPRSVAVEGAVFFRLSLATPAAGGTCIAALDEPAAKPESYADGLGRGPLASAFRLALAYGSPDRPPFFPGENFRLARN